MSLRSRLSRILRRSRPEVIEQSQRTTPDWRRGVWCPIVGGLANQLICYGVGRMLADIHRVPLLADLSHFQHTWTRPLLLWNFSPILDVVFHDESQVASWAAQASDLLASVTQRDTPHFWASDTQCRLRELYLKPPATPVLADLWVGLAFQIQARDYYRKVENSDKIRFNPNCLLTEDRELLDSIRSCRNSIAIHVRRTDFATHDGGLLTTAEQYNRAISYIEEKAGTCAIFVFSDDQTWCKKHLKAKGVIRHSPAQGEQDGHKDLYLASQCRHKILTNESTFSQMIDTISHYHASERIIVRCSARKQTPIFEEYNHS
jgi:hypothetical protein